ncbi:glutathione S-transferase family protein [Sphingomonas sp.]|jgi:glutathione S-transferase|uniref:glutathione S-transferase family protein n=1 Tax=Sphingomonas sp. TaxID=28214 RepID=UPI002E337607|nr:glutathione S-transferase family protein [Sphingomonas sp.]HEX4696035.1 glutathione S-transferase family protein [Sphingomonas sp.]
MTISLYEHPLSSYAQKAKTAFYEKGVPFESKMLDGSEPVASEFAALSPLGKFPLVTDGTRVVFESTAIIEYLEMRFPDTPRLVPGDPMTAVEARMWDRFFDNYLEMPFQRIVGTAIGLEVCDEAKMRGQLDTAYAMLDRHMAAREWAAGDAFSLADCSAAPALLYADWTHAIPKEHANVWAYRDRLLARPSYARALDEARPYRHMFPLGAPEGRD